ncbi:MAG: integrase, partial [Frankiales bacterium]|nr:integrase [Frankiales bacterium]
SSDLQPGQTPPPPLLLSARTVTYTHAVLRAALNDALRDEVPGLKRNVAELVSPPPKVPSTARPLKLSSLPLVLEAMDQHRWRALWLTYLGLGLRKGEALGLAWSDLDLEAGLVTISRSLRRRDGRLVDGPVKTAASGATVPVPSPLVRVLQQHRADQRRERLAAVAWAEPERVFTTARGTALEPRNVNTEWAKVCAAAGIEPIRLHDLRHSMATFALRQGVELKTIQTMLRHSRLSTTADLYTHVLQEVQRSGADRMGDLLHEFGVGRSAASDAGAATSAATRPSGTRTPPG